MTCDSCGFRNVSNAPACGVCGKAFTVVMAAPSAATFPVTTVDTSAYVMPSAFQSSTAASAPPEPPPYVRPTVADKSPSTRGFRKGLLLGRWAAVGGLIGDIMADFFNNDHKMTFFATLIYSGIWFALVGAGISIAITIGQARYLGTKQLQWKIISISGGFGFAAALIAGVIAQATYSLIGPTELLRDACWGLAGGLVGVALTLRIPNLGFARSLAGGLVGGILGGGLFILAAYLINDVIGRYVGCAAIGFCIGFMIVMSESLFREAWIDIRYGPKESRTVSLGTQPIIFGSDGSKSTVFVRGIAPMAYSFTLRDKKIEFRDLSSGKTSYLNSGATQPIGNLEVGVYGA